MIKAVIDHNDMRIYQEGLLKYLAGKVDEAKPTHTHSLSLSLSLYRENLEFSSHLLGKIR